ncbi:glutaminase [Nocardia sp. NPDC046763]|uniref:glutaminase n=1 Tax=Nocardia sp. NPDC046763 TaxID=3155256 RepID=UPI003405E24A
MAQVDPAGTAFSDLIELQLEHGIPRNPFVNAGASVVADQLLTDTGEAVNALRVLLRAETGNPARPRRPSRPLLDKLASYLGTTGHLEKGETVKPDTAK